MNFLIGLFTCLLHCIVCGANENEVAKLFCFPHREERSKTWQSLMGMVYRPKLSGHLRICNQHFTEDCFIPCTMPLRLRANAAPTITALNLIERTNIPVVTEPNLQVSGSEMDILPQIVELPADLNLLNPPALATEASNYVHEPQPCTSYQTIDEEVSGHGIVVKPDFMSQNLTSTKHSVKDKSRVRRLISEHVKGVRSVNVTRRKKALMSIVKKKRNQIKKLQNDCKRIGKMINILENIEKSPKMCNVLKNMSPAAIQSMIGQIRRSKQSSQGRR